MLQLLKGLLARLSLFEVHVPAGLPLLNRDPPSQDGVFPIIRRESFKSLNLYKVTVSKLQYLLSSVPAALPRLNRDSTAQDGVPPVFRLGTLKSLDLYEVTVNKLQHLLSSGRITSVEYVVFCLERIHKVSLPQRKDGWC